MEKTLKKHFNNGKKIKRLENRSRLELIIEDYLFNKTNFSGTFLS